MKGKNKIPPQKKKKKIENRKHTSQLLHVVEAIPHVTAVIQVKMADDREPPALFDDDADTPEATPEEQTNGDLFIGETTEITLDDGESKEDETPEESDKATGDRAGGDQEESAESSAAASVDVTNLSKPSKDDSEPAPKEKAEVGM